jgi:hypothetical protein
MRPSDGELYTIVTNKAAKGREGSIIAVVAGTKAETVIEVLQKIHIREYEQVIQKSECLVLMKS